MTSLSLSSGTFHRWPLRTGRGAGQTSNDYVGHRTFDGFLIAGWKIGIAETVTAKERDRLKHEAGGDRGIRDVRNLAAVRWPRG